MVESIAKLMSKSVTFYFFILSSWFIRKSLVEQCLLKLAKALMSPCIYKESYLSFYFNF